VTHPKISEISRISKEAMEAEYKKSPCKSPSPVEPSLQHINMSPHQHVSHQNSNKRCSLQYKTECKEKLVFFQLS